MFHRKLPAFESSGLGRRAAALPYACGSGERNGGCERDRRCHEHRCERRRSCSERRRSCYERRRSCYERRRSCSERRRSCYERRRRCFCSYFSWGGGPLCYPRPFSRPGRLCQCVFICQLHPRPSLFSRPLWRRLRRNR